jgi:hypothetical protein
MDESDDPMTMAMVAMTAGTGMNVMGQMSYGSQMEDISNARAAVDIANSKAAKKTAIEEAKITAERGREFLASQKANFAASNVKINIGSPMVLEAENEMNIRKDVGYIIERGWNQASQYRQSAVMEKAYGAAEKRKSRWSALGSGLQGFGSLAYMGVQGGMFGTNSGYTKEGLAMTTSRGPAGMGY